MAQDAGEDTKRRLMDAAGEVFSKEGFKGATVRTICRMAGANVAAVHYHFGGKEGLYTALLSEAFEAGLRRYPADMGLPATATAEERLFAFIHSFLLRTLGQGKSAWCGKLMDREMREPTPALDHIVAHHIMPLALRLRTIVAELLGGGATPDDPHTRLCSMSVAGQCQYVFRSKAILDRMLPEMRLDEAGIHALARHIHAFSLCALKSFGQYAEMSGKAESALETPG